MNFLRRQTYSAGYLCYVKGGLLTGVSGQEALIPTTFLDKRQVTQIVLQLEYSQN